MKRGQNKGMPWAQQMTPQGHPVFNTPQAVAAFYDARFQGVLRAKKGARDALLRHSWLATADLADLQRIWNARGQGKRPAPRRRAAAVAPQQAAAAPQRQRQRQPQRRRRRRRVPSLLARVSAKAAPRVPLTVAGAAQYMCRLFVGLFHNGAALQARLKSAHKAHLAAAQTKKFAQLPITSSAFLNTVATMLQSQLMHAVHKRAEAMRTTRSSKNLSSAQKAALERKAATLGILPSVVGVFWAVQRVSARFLMGWAFLQSPLSPLRGDIVNGNLSAVQLVGVVNEYLAFVGDRDVASLTMLRAFMKSRKSRKAPVLVLDDDNDTDTDTDTEAGKEADTETDDDGPLANTAPNKSDLANTAPSKSDGAAARLVYSDETESDSDNDAVADQGSVNITDGGRRRATQAVGSGTDESSDDESSDDDSSSDDDTTVLTQAHQRANEKWTKGHTEPFPQEKWQTFLDTVPDLEQGTVENVLDLWRDTLVPNDDADDA